MNLGTDESWKPLVDLFSNRVIGLFYQAWGKYRVEHGLDTRGQDELLPLLSALGGLRQASFGPARSYASLPAEVAGYYAGLLRTRPVAASTVERVLGEYFGVPVRVEEFVGAWDTLPEKIRSTLGVTKPTLGFGAALGIRAWRNDLRVRLHEWPVSRRIEGDGQPIRGAFGPVRSQAFAGHPVSQALDAGDWRTGSQAPWFEFLPDRQRWEGEPARYTFLPSAHGSEGPDRTMEPRRTGAGSPAVARFA